MPRSRTRSRRRTIALGAAVAALGALVVVGLVRGGGDDGRVPEGVTVDGIDVGGLSPGTARAAVTRHAREVASRPVTITSPDRPGWSVTVEPGSLRATPDVAGAIAAAQAPAGVGSRVLGAVGLAPGRKVALRWRMDDAALAAAVARVARASGPEPVDAGVVAEDGRLVVRRGRPGRGVDAEELARRLRTLPARISLPVVDRPPSIGTEAALAARARARALVADPPAVRGVGGTLPIRPGTLREALRFVPDAPDLRVALAPSVLAGPVRSAFGGVEEPVRDARFEPRGARVSIVPDRTGKVIDMPALATALAAAPGVIVDLPVATRRAERTAADLRALGVKALVGEFSTPYACCEPRVTNIRRAADILDGTVIPAGGRFSMNEALGERTEARGFVSAPQIAGGKFEEAVGGGVSQVASTVFNAAFFAGLQIVTHTPHEYWISRYPKGREATVSWGGPELVIRNDWPAAVYMDVAAFGDSVRVRMYSTPLGRRVVTTSGEPTDITEPTIKERVDPELPPGARVVDQPIGGAGFSISYTRRVYRGSDLTRDETYSWTYRPEDALVRVGPSTGTATGGTGTGGAGTTTGTQTQQAPPATTRQAPATGIPQTPSPSG